LLAGFRFRHHRIWGKYITLEAQQAEKVARLQLSGVEGSSHRSGLSAAQLITHGTESPQLHGDSKIFSFDPESFVKAFIAMPTVYIIGSNDPWAGYSKLLIKLCKAHLAKVVFHNGAHKISQNQGSLRLCAELIEAAVSTAQRGQGV
jgi:hypothetical protein